MWAGVERVQVATVGMHIYTLRHTFVRSIEIEIKSQMNEYLPIYIKVRYSLFEQTSIQLLIQPLTIMRAFRAS